MYTLTHIVPLPLNKTKFLIVPNYILHDKDKQILYVEDKCPKIHRTYICEGARTQTKLINIHCLDGILRNQTATCDVKDVGQQEMIKEIEQRYIFIFNTINTHITSSCQEPFTINGSAKLTFNNCTVKVNGLTYDDTVMEFDQETKMCVKSFEQMNIKNTFEDINLHKLHLQAL